MAKKQDDNRQKKEISRLKSIYENLPEDRLKVIEKLIDRAAYMLVSLQDMESRMNKDGLLTEMKQGEYSIERAHPLLSPYNTMVKNYASVVKQMNEILPNTEQDAAGQALMAFVSKTGHKK